MSKKKEKNFNTSLVIYGAQTECREVDAEHLNSWDVNRLGHYIGVKNLIEIRETLNYLTKFHTLIHEVCHVIMDNSGISCLGDLDDAQKEMYNTALSSGITDFLWHNREKIKEWLS
jgi:hypothetical protein